MFSCEYCEIFKNTYFEKHLRIAASEYVFIVHFSKHKSIMSIIFGGASLRFNCQEIDTKSHKMSCII